MKKYSSSDKESSGSSGIIIKVQPFFIKLKFFMINYESFLQIFIVKSHMAIFCQKRGTRQLALVLGTHFTYLQHIFSTLYLVLHLKSKTTSQHPLDIIDSQIRSPCHYKIYCVKLYYYWCLIQFFEFLLLKCKQMYTQYSSSHKCHCQELIFFLALLF